jgi:hypothetical protein
MASISDEHYGNTGCEVFIGRDTKKNTFLIENENLIVLSSQKREI